ncbi:MAG: hypothetical protein A2289_15150 [Deltaproteobacteria bacterium RIFOXYA12_FULL_58_15]|nr:MAG: hypothetical protein A2289_15150 [Deltaproteobacteria bacterium RIFOXYA12_FULL_58_15]OGR13780.1 MAG: hypothetical protein A2341_01055 [Deltaproteobacteria bacterium RIFOXYB12_FULL_58_9]
MSLTFITRNITLKLISLAVSLLIFLFVNVESSTPVEVDFPVEYRTANDMMVTNDPPSVLHTTMQGPWANFRSFVQSELNPVIIDLSNDEPGDHLKRIELDDVDPPGGMRIVGVRPVEVELILDRKVERRVPVEPTIMERPAFGYEILRVQIEPSEVRVVGPVTKVGDPRFFIRTEPINVARQTADVTMEVDLRPPGEGARLLDRHVKVEVQINEEFVEKSFKGVEVQLDHGPAGARVTPHSVEVTLKGPRRLVDKLDANSLKVYVDALPEINEGQRSFEKIVILRSAPERTVLLEPVPTVVVQVSRSRRRR